MKSFVVLIVVVFLGATGFAQSLSGVLLDNETKKPISGAVITLTDQGISTYSTESGSFEFNTSLPDVVRIIVDAKGYDPYFNTLVAPSGSAMQILLTPCHVELDEIHIVASRGVLQKESVTHIENKKLEDLNVIKSTNLGEAISKIPGVYTSSTGNGISKPVIRGLSGTRVITMLNGIRVENQQWGSDHGMAVTSLGIGSVEVIKGPASLLYGSDALGGVIYFVDESYTANNMTTVKFGSSFETNSNNTQSYAGVKFSEKRIRMNVFAGYNSAADFRLPNNNYLVNSRYQDRMAKLSIGYANGKWVTNVRYNYLNSFVGIPGESEDSIVTPLSFQSSNTSRSLEVPFQFIENHIASWENKFFLSRGRELMVNFGHTYNSLNEFEENADTAALSMGLNSTVYTVRYKQSLFNRLTTTVGFQGMNQFNKNAENAEEQLIPNANTLDNGVFLIGEMNVRKFIVQAGLRADFRSISVLDDSIDFSKQYKSFTYSGGVLRSHKNSTYRFNVSSGFRAPHTSELLANGAHEGALRYEIGSVTLRTEQATQVDFAYELSNEHISLVANPFVNRINNYIYLKPTDSIVDGRPVFVYDQTNNVALYGVDFGIHLHPHSLHGLHIESTYSYVRGERHSGTSLPFIPQSRINTLIKVPLDFNKDESKSIGFFALQHSYYFSQDRISEFETATKAYSLFDASFTLKPGKAGHEICTVSGGVKNIFNTSYFNHLSSLKNIGIQQPGRNYYVSVQFNLERKRN